MQGWETPKHAEAYLRRLERRRQAVIASQSKG